jgi:hypothetical protein
MNPHKANVTLLCRLHILKFLVLQFFQLFTILQVSLLGTVTYLNTLFSNTADLCSFLDWESSSGSEVFMTLTVRSVVFWVYRHAIGRFRRFDRTHRLYLVMLPIASARFLLDLVSDPDVGCNMFFRNVELSPNYTELHPRRLYSSSSDNISR